MKTLKELQKLLKGSNITIVGQTAPQNPLKVFIHINIINTVPSNDEIKYYWSTPSEKEYLSKLITVPTSNFLSNLSEELTLDDPELKELDLKEWHIIESITPDVFRLQKETSQRYVVRSSAAVTKEPFCKYLVGKNNIKSYSIETKELPDRGLIGGTFNCINTSTDLLKGIITDNQRNYLKRKLKSKFIPAFNLIEVKFKYKIR